MKGKHPHGFMYKFLNILEEKYKPRDASAKISLMSELRAIPFKMAHDFYNDVVGVTANRRTGTHEVPQMGAFTFLAS